jgi:hypothetical protein
LVEERSKGSLFFFLFSEFNLSLVSNSPLPYSTDAMLTEHNREQ